MPHVTRSHSTALSSAISVLKRCAHVAGVLKLATPQELKALNDRIQSLEFRIADAKRKGDGAVVKQLGMELAKLREQFDALISGAGMSRFMRETKGARSKGEVWARLAKVAARRTAAGKTTRSKTLQAVFVLEEAHDVAGRLRLAAPSRLAQIGRALQAVRQAVALQDERTAGLRLSETRRALDDVLAARKLAVGSTTWRKLAARAKQSAGLRYDRQHPGPSEPEWAKDRRSLVDQAIAEGRQNDDSPRLDHLIHQMSMEQFAEYRKRVGMPLSDEEYAAEDALRSRGRRVGGAYRKTADLRWEAQGGCCGACQEKDGSVYAEGEVPEHPLHPNCKCELVEARRVQAVDDASAASAPGGTEVSELDIDVAADTLWEDAVMTAEGYFAEDEDEAFTAGPGDVPEMAREEARRVLTEIQQANGGKTISDLFAEDVAAHGGDEAQGEESFVHYLVMQYLGHGVGWRDWDHSIQVPQGENQLFPEAQTYVYQSVFGDEGEARLEQRLNAEHGDGSTSVEASRKVAYGGYTDCACRDCFEIAIGKPGHAMCQDCEAAGCDGEGECQAPGAYGVGEEDGSEVLGRRVQARIEHEGDEWVVKSEHGKTMGRHPTEEKAKAQLAAVEISKHGG